MQDTCIVQTCTQTANTMGEMVETFSDGSAEPCGLDMRSGKERRSVDNVITEYDATIRLAYGRILSAKSRIKITKRFEETLSTPLVYEIVSPHQQLVSGARYLLRRISL